MQKDDSCSFRIQWKDFYGQVNLGQDQTLRIEITSLQNQSFYVLQIKNEEIKRQFKNYIVFKQTRQLFNQIKCNNNINLLTIGQYNYLHIPIQIIFRHRLIELAIDIPLSIKTFKDQNQKCVRLFKEVKKLYQENFQRKSIPQLIDFKFDQTNVNYKLFQINNRRIKKIGAKQQHTTLNHANCLPSKGIFYFKTKVVKSPTKYIFIGICGKESKQIINCHHGPYFMAVYLFNARLYGNNIDPLVITPKLEIIQDQTVLKVEISVNKKQIAWYVDQTLIYSTKIWKKLAETDIYPIINLWAEGDILQLLD